MTISQTQAGARSIGIQGAWDAIGAPALDSHFNPDFVLEFARVRISQVNSWLSRSLDTMKLNQQSSNALNEALKTTAHLADGWDNKNEQRGEKFKTLKAGLKAAAELAPTGSEIQQKLLALVNDPDSIVNAGGDDVVIKVEMDKLTQDLNTSLKSLDARGQEDQLMVNQKMSERSEILQLCATLIQQLNETVKTILAKA